MNLDPIHYNTALRTGIRQQRANLEGMRALLNSAGVDLEGYYKIMGGLDTLDWEAQQQIVAAMPEWNVHGIVYRLYPQFTSRDVTLTLGNPDKTDLYSWHWPVWGTLLERITDLNPVDILTYGGRTFLGFDHGDPVAQTYVEVVVVV